MCLWKTNYNKLREKTSVSQKQSKIRKKKRRKNKAFIEKITIQGLPCGKIYYAGMSEISSFSIFTMKLKKNTGKVSFKSFDVER